MSGDGKNFGTSAESSTQGASSTRNVGPPLTGKRLLYVLHGSCLHLPFKKIINGQGKADAVIVWAIGFLNETSGWLSNAISKEEYANNEKQVVALVEDLELHYSPRGETDVRADIDINRFIARSLLAGRLEPNDYSDLFWERNESEIFAALHLLSHFSIDFKDEFRNISLSHGLFDILRTYWFEPQFAKFTEFSYSILVNMTTMSEMCEFICNKKPDICVQLLDRIQNQTEEGLNINTMHTLNAVARVLCNLSRVEAFQRFLLDPIKMPILQFGNYMRKFMEIKTSEVYREYLAATIKNCLFRKEQHKWLTDEADILSTILMPLAGNETFTEEENSKLPPDLQYLPENKLREPCLKVRVRLLEGFLQLCQTREIREIIRENNAYLILREYHKWETESRAVEILEDIINILIRTEDEIGVADYNEIPEEELSRTLKIEPSE